MPQIAMPRPFAGFDYPKLRSWREAAGLTREQACPGLGVTLSYLTALELGLRVPRVAVIIRLAEFYGHDPGELLIGSGGAR